ncbi:MAG: class I SAM-dependent methyltransferase [Candidatus Omnitrophota bacterium]
MKNKFRIGTDPQFGFKYLKPIPSQKQLDEFYRRKYYRLSVAPQIKRFMKGGAVARKEKAWYAKTLWTDVRDSLRRWKPKGQGRLLDIGAGTGDFARFMAQNGWKVTAIEPSLAATQKALRSGVSMFPSIEAYEEEAGTGRFDVITFLNVLEHVPHPVAVLKHYASRLKKGGVLVAQVPNDFSPLQLLAQKKLRKKPWWIFIPDHCNYFNAASMRKIFRHLHFKELDCLSDFPMELFLLFGDNYIEDPQTGARCHQKRVRFDTGLPASMRRSIYQSLSKVQVGRNLLFFARKGKA